jgi:hypothetical protein
MLKDGKTLIEEANVEKVKTGAEKMLFLSASFIQSKKLRPPRCRN